MNKHNRALSLVEVVVAMGLISFAMIVILAFFPVGLGSNRSSAKDTRAAQIVRAITDTIDSQSSTFGAVKCYGLTLDLTSLGTMSTQSSSLNEKLYASY